MLFSMTTFAIAALLLIMLPGPDQALITRNALAGGRYGGALTMLGGDGQGWAGSGRSGLQPRSTR